MRVPLLDLKAQYETIRMEIITEIEEVFESQQFILGPKVTLFEEAIAAYSGCKYGVGVSSGTDALLICLMAEEIGPGDEVITTPYTFFATAGSIARTGAKPVFVDIQKDTYNIDPNLIEDKISQRTRAIIPVHLFGQCADMDPILDIARRHGLVVIEDAAQAIGAEYVSRNSYSLTIKRAGCMGDYGCFSFFPSKNLGGFGDGGMVVTNDPDRAEKLRVLRGHGSKPKYYHRLIGGNFRLDALQAAVLLVKFSHLDEWTFKRQQNAALYDAEFYSCGLVEKGAIKLPKAVWKENLENIHPGPESEQRALHSHYHIYNQYVISTPLRDRVKSHLSENGIGTEIYYPVPLHLQECLSSLGYQTGSFPVSEAASKETIALPIYPELTLKELQFVIDSIKKAVN